MAYLSFDFSRKKMFLYSLVTGCFPFESCVFNNESNMKIEIFA